MKVVVIGGRETVAAFRLLGAEGFVVDSPEELLDKLWEIERERSDVGFVVVEEEFAEKVRDSLDRFKLEKPVPVVVEVPKPGEDVKFSKDYMVILKKALGFG